ncbi:hypothetical protein CVU37_03000 [candidate division BRC1 bacterium HGW-BRC1-1]|jgi:type II secretion system protein E|nr:MAG: hypothetical protein CVU37_03000 [candidate division BRC1 bacterium HGW-BRC1-1]
MAFFKKLVPGKGNGSNDPLEGEAAKRADQNKGGAKRDGPIDPVLQAELAKALRKDPVASSEEAGGRVNQQSYSGDMAMGGSMNMLQMLSEQAGLPYVKLSEATKGHLTPKLLKLVPAATARFYKVFPVQLRPNGVLVVAISDPLNVRIMDDLRLTLAGGEVKDLEAVVAHEEEIVDYINLHYGVGDVNLQDLVDDFERDDDDGSLVTTAGAIDLSDLEQISADQPIIRFCSLLLLQAIKERASDIHLEPFSNVLRIRYRVDGVLREIPSPPKSWQIGILSRFKVMSNLDISETRRPQDGRMKLTVDGRDVDIRLSTLPVVYGEAMAMRLLDKNMMRIGVHQIGMTQDVLDRFLKMIERPNGILLVTGPTGCGKTTTLYAALNEINDPTEKIITTEDPVEYQLDGIIQININTAVDLTFSRCLRAILRQDPDVILVGEIRDAETAQIAIQASLTGHLVFSTLHTNSAAGCVTRLVDMGIEPFLINSTLEGIIGQRLVRTVCSGCKKPYTPTAEELEDFGVKPADVTDLTFFKGTGCDECSHSGYRGRLGIFELLPISEEIRDQIYNHASTDEIHAMALKQGMKTMRQDGWLKICAGITTFEEVAKHTPRETAEQIKNEMEEMLEQTIGKTPESGTGNAPGENISMSDLSGTEPWSEESGTKPADS